MIPPAAADKSSLSNSAASALALIAALVIAGILAAGGALGVVFLWYSNAKGDALAALIITFIGIGLFANLVGFTALVSRHHVPRTYTLLAAIVPWFSLAVVETWATCKEASITWHNWRWVAKGADFRIYQLSWIFNGWLVISISALLALTATRNLIRRAQARQASAGER